MLPPTWVAGFFLWTSGIHVGIVAADPGFYRHFADNAILPGLADVWRTAFMAHAVVAGLVVAAGEAMIAALLFGPRPYRKAGWFLTIAFHVALLLFGWGFWLWSIPALVLLVPAAAADRAPR